MTHCSGSFLCGASPRRWRRASAHCRRGCCQGHSAPRNGSSAIATWGRASWPRTRPAPGPTNCGPTASAGSRAWRRSATCRPPACSWGRSSSSSWGYQSSPSLRPRASSVTLPRRLRRYCFLVGAGLAVACALWGAALLVTVPRGLGQLLLGRELWRPAYRLVIPYAISIMGSCFTDGANAGLHALGAAKRSLRSMICSSLIYLGFGIVGAYVDGAVGVVWGAAFATWLGAALWWRQLYNGMHEAGHWSPRGADRGLPPGTAPRPPRPRGKRTGGRMSTASLLLAWRGPSPDARRQPVYQGPTAADPVGHAGDTRPPALAPCCRTSRWVDGELRPRG